MSNQSKSDFKRVEYFQLAAELARYRQDLLERLGGLEAQQRSLGRGTLLLGALYPASLLFVPQWQSWLIGGTWALCLAIACFTLLLMASQQRDLHLRLASEVAQAEMGADASAWLEFEVHALLEDPPDERRRYGTWDWLKRVVHAANLAKGTEEFYYIEDLLLLAAHRKLSYLARGIHAKRQADREAARETNRLLDF